MVLVVMDLIGDMAGALFFTLNRDMAVDTKLLNV